MSDITVLHVEVCQKPESKLGSDAIQEKFESYFAQIKDFTLNIAWREHPFPDHVLYYRVCSSPERENEVYIPDDTSERVPRIYHIYKLWEESPQEELLDGEEQVPASLNWCLPNVAFEGLWESLIFENDTKEQLMNYVQTALSFSAKQVNAQIIHWNGVVLLHGPPGTGKTSLCKALAQKLSIRMNSKYRTIQLIEINTNSLFSKWFSESAKLVLKMFSSITEFLQTKDHFVCILLDEVESLTQVRKSNDCEPSDSIRVVNVVLTQIDQLQRYSNYLILATTNMNSAIDSAFTDRTDLRLYMRNPSDWGTYNILKTCLEELMRCNLLKGKCNHFLNDSILKRMKDLRGTITVDDVVRNSEALLKISQEFGGEMSGRTLRKIPFLTSSVFSNRNIPTVEEFLVVMKNVLKKHKDDEKNFLKTSET